MIHRHKIGLIAAMVAWALVGSSAIAQTADRALPNVVFFLIDDLGWEDVGFMGSTYYRTPRIDQLAADGVVFTDAYSSGPNCVPTRAALISGQHPPRTGIVATVRSARGPDYARRLLVPPSEIELKPAITTLAEAFKAAGYATAHIGKWHLETGPTEHGFDINIGGSRRGVGRDGYFAPYNNLPNLKSGPKGEYLTDRLTDEAIAFIDTNAKQPFFLYLAHYAVHKPIQAKSEMVGPYQLVSETDRQGSPEYAAMVESVDESVGRIADRLDELGIAENTIIVFTSDNGGHLGATSMPSLRGGKGMLYEGGVRVPTFVRWPGVPPAGARTDHVVTSIDFYPTLMELIGASVPAGAMLDGVSFADVIRTGKSSAPRPPIYWHFPAYSGQLGSNAAQPTTTIYQRFLAYLQLGNSAKRYEFKATPAAVVRDGRWKLIEFFEDGQLELYDLETDRAETTNLALHQPHIVARLREDLHRWRKEVNANMPLGPNPAFDPDRGPLKRAEPVTWERVTAKLLALRPERDE